MLTPCRRDRTKQMLAVIRGEEIFCGETEDGHPISLMSAETLDRLTYNSCIKTLLKFLSLNSGAFLALILLFLLKENHNLTPGRKTLLRFSMCPETPHKDMRDSKLLQLLSPSEFN